MENAVQEFREIKKLILECIKLMFSLNYGPKTQEIDEIIEQYTKRGEKETKVSDFRNEIARMLNQISDLFMDFQEKKMINNSDQEKQVVLRDPEIFNKTLREENERLQRSLEKSQDQNIEALQNFLELSESRKKEIKGLKDNIKQRESEIEVKQAEIQVLAKTLAKKNLLIEDLTKEIEAKVKEISDINEEKNEYCNYLKRQEDVSHNEINVAKLINGNYRK